MTHHNDRYVSMLEEEERKLLEQLAEHGIAMQLTNRSRAIDRSNVFSMANGGNDDVGANVNSLNVDVIWTETTERATTVAATTKEAATVAATTKEAATVAGSTSEASTAVAETAEEATTIARTTEEATIVVTDVDTETTKEAATATKTGATCSSNSPSATCSSNLPSMVLRRSQLVGSRQSTPARSDDSKSITTINSEEIMTLCDTVDVHANEIFGSRPDRLGSRVTTQEEQLIALKLQMVRRDASDRDMKARLAKLEEHVASLVM